MRSLDITARHRYSMFETPESKECRPGVIFRLLQQERKMATEYYHMVEGYREMASKIHSILCFLENDLKAIIENSCSHDFSDRAYEELLEAMERADMFTEEECKVLMDEFMQTKPKETL